MCIESSGKCKVVSRQPMGYDELSKWFRVNAKAKRQDRLPGV